MIQGLRIDPGDAIPIWKQIEDGVRRLVASAGVQPGSAVPSVREMARRLRVNPATVAKAYQRLTDAGLLTVRRGEGTFVSDAPPAMPSDERLREIDAGAARFVTVAHTIGASRKEAIEGVNRAWARLQGEPKDGDRE